MELGFFRRLQITSQGVEYRRGRELRRLAWHDVLILRLIRESQGRVFLHRLELHLRSGDTISGRVTTVRVDGRRIWSGRRSSDWPQQLESLTPTGCWQVFYTVGDLRSRAEGEFRLAYLRKNLVVDRRKRAVLPPLFLIMLGLCFVPKLVTVAAWDTQLISPWWKAAALLCLALSMLVPPLLVWVLCQASLTHCTRRCNETAKELSRFPATDDAPITTPQP